MITPIHPAATLGTSADDSDFEPDLLSGTGAILDNYECQ